MTDNPEELKAHAEEKKQETEQIIKLQRRKSLTPSLLLGILSVYLLFIGTVVGLGTLAFYSGHIVTLKIVFFICIALLLIVPVGVIWNWRVLFPRKPSESATIGKERLLDRIKQSAVTRALARFGNNRWVRIFNFCYFVIVIILNIRSFPMHPRFSLGMIVSYLAISFVLWVSWATETLERQIDKRINGILDVLVSVIEMVDYARKLGEGSLKYIADTEPSRLEAEQARMAALATTTESLNAIWEFVRKYVHAKSDENEPTNT